MAEKNKTISNEQLWYKDAVIYELHIKAFKDENEDGIGDFKGLLQKLDYLEFLGVTAIWLLPFYPSPFKDDGYDIADYYTIHPNYGKMRDFKRFIREAHKRYIKVITELVINHTSDQHPWFQRARKAKPGSVYRDYYVWSDNPEKYSETRIIFQDFETSNWTWDPVAEAYFWHRFYSHQPDLNYDNPKVQEEIFKVIDYWADTGVDGFRLDAVPYLYERENTNCENLPETHAFLKKLRKHIDEKHDNVMLLAEANMWPEDAAAYFGKGDECHMNFHFPLMPRMFMSIKMENRYPIIDIFDQTPEIPENCQWATFLRNHDELTLEMVTDEERDYMYKMYTKDSLSRINLGIRHRLAPLLNNDRRKIELMNVLLFSLPGTPVIYYGDEIGMGDNFYLGDRDGVRTPMQWDDNRNAGFSSANPQKLYLPVIIDPEYSYEGVNVSTQQHNPSSLFWWMKRLIGMRKRFKAFGRGRIQFLTSSNAKILAFVREYEDEVILVIANLSRFSQAAELELQGYSGWQPEEVFSQNKFPMITKKPYLFTLTPYGYHWFRLKKEDVEATTRKPQTIKLRQWKDLVKAEQLQLLEQKVLPAYLKKCRWFSGKAQVVRKIKMEENLFFPGKDMQAALLIIKVNYTDALPEFYQLPVTVGFEEKEKYIREQKPQGLITTVEIGGQEGVLYDAAYDEAFRTMLFQMMTQKKRLRFNKGKLVFYAKPELKALLKEKENISSKVLNIEQSNTSIIYENQYFLKLYRKVDRVINPEMETLRFLSDKAKFKHVSKFVGSIENQQQGAASMVLGVMQEWVSHHGDFWSYMQDNLRRYFDKVLSSNSLKDVRAPHDNWAKTKFRDLPEERQELLGDTNVQFVQLLGERTAELHLALASDKTDEIFKPENFSLHYQRSLFSSLQTLVRGSFQSLERQRKNFPENEKKEAKQVLGLKQAILKNMRRIFDHKIPVIKTRTHGDYHLGQVLFTGNDFVIIDFEGEPGLPMSQRRIKRSPLRDVAGMVRSFFYAPHNILISDNHFSGSNLPYLEKWADLWYYYISGFFIQAYLERAKDASFIPPDPEDFKLLMEIFLLEKAVYELEYELNNRPNWVMLPLRGIKYLMKQQHHEIEAQKQKS